MENFKTIKKKLLLCFVFVFLRLFLLSYLVICCRVLQLRATRGHHACTYPRLHTHTRGCCQKSSLFTFDIPLATRQSAIPAGVHSTARLRLYHFGYLPASLIRAPSSPPPHRPSSSRPNFFYIFFFCCKCPAKTGVMGPIRRMRVSLSKASSAGNCGPLISSLIIITLR